MYEENFMLLSDGAVHQDQYVQVGSVKARYWAAGTSGPQVLLLHGIGASVEIWRGTLKALGARHRVLALDMPGFGRSDKPAASYSLAYLAAFVRDFVDAMGIERTSLVGHSLGGGVALRFALDFPERLERLGLVAPAGLGRGGSPLLRMMSLPVMGELLARPSRAGTAMLFETATFSKGAVDDASIEEAYQLSRLPGAKRAFLATLRALANVFGQRSTVVGPIVDGLRSINAPTLVLWGREDKILPSSQAAQARLITGARVEIWDSCGHLPMLEYSVAFNASLAEFLAAR